VSVCVVVPFRGGCSHREAAWEFVRRLYVERHPDWVVVEAEAPTGEWCKGAAINPVIDGCEADIVIQADGDVWCGGLAEAVGAVRGGAPWAIPHTMVHRLSEDGTRDVLAGEPWPGEDDKSAHAQRPYQGVAGGGILVASREALLAAPLDRRFRGWGQDDEAHALALNALVGQPWRGDAPLFHLWHPPQPRITRRRGSRESWRLRCRYVRCRDDPAAMAALLEESRVADRFDQDAMHHHPALAGH
jgi:hypothetical protein